MSDLFSDLDLDQDLLEKEREEKERAVIEKKKEKKSGEKKSYSKNLYIIDGYSLIYRSYFAFLSRPLTDRNGNNISAYYGFFNTLLSLMREHKMDYIAVTMDEKEETFRHKMYPEYKANRMKAPDDLHAQVPLITETLSKMGIRVLSHPGFEADDVIASLSKKAERNGIRTIMVTGDKDLLQLVSDSVYALRPPKKGETSYSLYTEKEVYEDFKVKPSQIIDYLSLLGDASDNVPGVKGIGEKGAVKLLEEYVSLDGIYRNLDHVSASLKKKLEEGREMATLSKELVTLSFDALDDPFDFESLSISNVNKDGARSDFNLLTLKSLERKLGKKEASEDEENKEEVKDDDAVQIRADEVFYQGSGVYESLTDIKEIRKKFDDAIAFHDAIIAFDTETTGFEEDASIIGFSFSYELKKAYYCPLYAEDKAYLKKDDVKSLFDDYFATGRIKVVGQNLKYDLKILWNLGTDIKAIEFDTMLASWMIESNQSQFNLEMLAKRYLDYEGIRFEDIVEKGKQFSSISLKTATEYAAEDADLTFRLYYILKKRLIENSMLSCFSSIELPLIRVLAQMERKGISISDEKMANLKETVDMRVKSLEERIYELSGHEFNINSTQQLAKVLFTELGLEAGKKTQRGYSTDSATLEGLRKSGGEIVEKILDYRMMAKLKSTYIDVLPTLKGPDGRIHTSFLQTGTATGRLSSRNPNLQNIPVRSDEGRLIRGAFVPEKGNIFISADYSQIELVVLAHVAGDEELKSAFINSIDVHRYTASLIFNKNVEDVTHSERQTAKTINFGIMYGMSAFRLSNELSISRKEAESFINTYFERYNGIKSFVERTVKDAEKNGYVETIFGHRRIIAGINSRNKTEKNAAERVAVNTVIQGSASEIMKRAMIALSEIDKSYLVLQVHDELIFECPESEVDEVSRRVKDVMENTTKLSIPVRASVESGKCWGDMH